MGVFSRFMSVFHRDQPTIWLAVAQWLIICLLAGVPLFFYPGNSAPVEFPKAFFFVIITGLAAVALCIDAALRHQLPLIRRPFGWLIGGFVVFVVVSGAFSFNWYVSLVGVSGFHHAGMIIMLAYVVCAWIIIHTLTTWRVVWQYFIALLAGSGLALGSALLQVSSRFILPGGITDSVQFNPLSNTSAVVSLISAVVLFFGMVTLQYAPRQWRIAPAALALLGAVVLYRYQVVVPMYLLGGMGLLWFVYASIHSRLLSRWWVVLPTITVVIAAGLLLSTGFSFRPSVVSEQVSLDADTGLYLTQQRLIESPLWGSGPQTFYYDFSSLRPVRFNDTALWNVRFVKSSSEWLGMVSMLGVGAVFFLVLLSGWVVWHVYQAVRPSKRHSPSDMWLGTVGIAWLGMTVFGMVANVSVVYWVWWWALLALILGVGELHGVWRIRGIWKFTGGFGPWRIVPVVVVAGVLVVVVARGYMVWNADRHFIRAQDEIAAQAPFQDIVDEITVALRHNPWDARLYLLKAQGYAAHARSIQESGAETDGVVQQYAQVVIDTLISVQTRFVADPTIPEREASVYDTLRGVVSNVDQLSVSAYAKAAVLNPTDPLIRLNLGRARLLAAQSPQSDALNDEARSAITQAIGDFRQAAGMKRDFIIADFNIALAYQTLGDTEQAITHLESTIARYPDNPDARYALATLHYEAGQYDTALQGYQQVLDMAPGYLGVYWQRSLIYEAQDQRDRAMTELQSLMQLDPGNTQAADRLNQLQNSVQPSVP